MRPAQVPAYAMRVQWYGEPNVPLTQQPLAIKAENSAVREQLVRRGHNVR